MSRNDSRIEACVAQVFPQGAAVGAAAAGAAPSLPVAHTNAKAGTHARTSGGGGSGIVRSRYRAVLSPAPASAIDVFSTSYREVCGRAEGAAPKDSFFQSIFQQFMPLYVLDTRFKDTVTDIRGYKQVVSCVGAPLEEIADPPRAAELAIMANDGLAELVKTIRTGSLRRSAICR